MKFIKIITPVLLLAVIPSVAFGGIQGSVHVDQVSSVDRGPDRCLMEFPHNRFASQYWNCNVGFAD